VWWRRVGWHVFTIRSLRSVGGALGASEYGLRMLLDGRSTEKSTFVRSRSCLSNVINTAPAPQFVTE